MSAMDRSEEGSRCSDDEEYDEESSNLRNNILTCSLSNLNLPKRRLVNATPGIKNTEDPMLFSELIVFNKLFLLIQSIQLSTLLCRPGLLT